ncbi:MAG TPA: PhzF family phenazine biosynthesis isomerase [Rickettsiales bacterium]|nr:PhzF family phenazine biosynthesis isomerase [Rickettsiales bacterium]
MIIIRGIVFNSNIKIADNKTAIGNPASVVILDNQDDLKDTKLLQPIAIKENQPITCFVKQRTKNNEFDIRFFTPSGDEVNICGHGSLISGKILKEHFKIKEKEIILHLNKDICLGTMLESDDPIETIYIENNGGISIKLFRIPFDKNTLSKNELSILQSVIKILDLTENDIQDYIKSDEYHDLILILKDVNKLRNLNPNFEAMIPYCKQIKDLRSVSFSAKSNLKDFDYETRVFAPHINVNEDIVCVSINSALSDYWSRQLNKNNLNVLYPYHWNENICGGIQHINVEDKYIVLII